MKINIYVSFLTFCAILSEGIGTSFNTSSIKENIEESPNIHTRNKRVIDRTISRSIPIRLKDFPYMVTLHKNGLFICGGCILAAHVIISAAHCFLDSNANYTIMSGSDYTNGGQTHEVVRHMAYPNYTHGILLHDVTLITIMPPIDLVHSPNRPIKLFEEDVTEGSMVIIIGWGYSSQSGVMTHTGELLYAVTRILDERECQRICGAPDYLAKLRICTADSFGHANSCSGDSGGPVVYLDQLLGIQSCSVVHSVVNGRKPDISTNLSQPPYKIWIKAFLRHYEFTFSHNARLNHNMEHNLHGHFHQNRRQNPHYNQYHARNIH